MRLACDQEKTTTLARRSLGAPAEHHHVSPSQPDYGQLPPFKRDVERAKKVLAEAGYPNGIDVEIPFYAPKDIDWNVAVAQAVVEQWKEAGIRVKLEVMAGPQFWESWDKHPFSITRWSHRPLGILSLSLAYRGGAAWNDANWKNARFDELLGQAEGLVKVEERRKVMAEMQKILQEVGPSVQPTWASVFTFMNKRVQGFQMHPTLYLTPNRMGVSA